MNDEGMRWRAGAPGDPNYDSADRAFRENLDVTTEDLAEEPELPEPGLFTQPPLGGGQNRPEYGGSENEGCNFFVSWFMWLCESCCGFNASLTKQNPFGVAGLYAYGICLTWIVLLDGFASIVLKVYRLIIRFLNWFWESLIVTMYFGVPAIFIYILLFVLLFLLSTYWQVVLIYVIKFLIPLLNIIIMLWNFFIRLFLIFYRLSATMWNIFVPFMGMIIFVVIKLVVTILQIVFDILASDGFMSIIQSLMEIIIALVEIVIGILMKLIQLGMPILKIVAQILPIILEVIFTVIEVALEIIVWIINLLFKIIEPILGLIAAFFSAFTFAALFASSNKTSRKLFSLATGVDESSLRALAALGMGAAAITHMQETLLRSGKVDGFNGDMFAARYAASPDAHSDEWSTFLEYAYVQGKQYMDNAPEPTLSELDEGWYEFVTEVEEGAPPVRFAQHANYTSTLGTGRKPLAFGDDALGGLGALDMGVMDAVMPKSMEEMRIESTRAKAAERTRSATAASARNVGGDLPRVDAPHNTAGAPKKKGLSTGDRNTQIISDTFHNYAYARTNEGDTQWLDVAHYTLNRINRHNKRGLGRTNPIIYLKKARRQFPELFSEPSALTGFRYSSDPHPGELHIDLKNARHNYVRKNGLEYSTWKHYEESLASRGMRGGRALLSVEKVQRAVDPIEHSRYLHLRDMELDHAGQIARAYDRHEDRGVRHAVLVQKVGNALVQDLRYHADNTVHPDKLVRHVNSALNYHGYESLQHAFDHFMKFHLEGGVVKALTIRDWPGFSFLSGYGEDESARPSFRGWAAEEAHLREMRGGRSLLAFDSDSERAYAQEDDIKANADKRGATADQSTGAFEGLEILTEGDCFSEDKNPLCLPIPASDLAERLQIGLIKLDERITEDSNLCDPWKLETIQEPSWLPGVFRWALTHIYNTGVSFAFLISAFPLTNILLTSFRLLFPFLSWLVDWVFVVPPNRFASFAQIYCFFVNLYSVMVTWYLWLIARYVLYELLLLVLEIITDLCMKPYAENKELTSRFLEQQENDPALRKALYEGALFRKIIDREHKREEAATRQQVRMDEYDSARDVELLRDDGLVESAIGDCVGDMPRHHHHALRLHVHHHPRHFSQQAMVHELRHLASVMRFAQLAQEDPALFHQLCKYIASHVIRVHEDAERPLLGDEAGGVERGHHVEAHVTLQEMYPSLFGINQTRARIGHGPAASSSDAYHSV